MSHRAIISYSKNYFTLMSALPNLQGPRHIFLAQASNIDTSYIQNGFHSYVHLTSRHKDDYCMYFICIVEYIKLFVCMPPRIGHGVTVQLCARVRKDYLVNFYMPDML